MSVPRPSDVIGFIGRNSKRLAVSVAGGVLVLAGLVLLVLPGPGILVVVLGFAVLGTEYAWAAAALARTRRAAERVGEVARGGAAATGRTTTVAARSLFRRRRRAQV